MRTHCFLLVSCPPKLDSFRDKERDTPLSSFSKPFYSTLTPLSTTVHYYHLVLQQPLLLSITTSDTPTMISHNPSSSTRTGAVSIMSAPSSPSFSSSAPYNYIAPQLCTKWQDKLIGRPHLNSVKFSEQVVANKKLTISCLLFHSIL